MEQKVKAIASKAATSRSEESGGQAGDQKMEQIRELMFGGISRDIDRRLKEMSERIDGEVKRLANDQLKQIQELETRMTQQVDRLQTQVRQEQAARSGAIDDVDARFSQAMRSQRAELTAVLQQHEDQASASETRSREALSDLRAQLQRSVQILKDDAATDKAKVYAEKLAREDMADLLAELSLRLRDSLSPSGGN